MPPPRPMTMLQARVLEDRATNLLTSAAKPLLYPMRTDFGVRANTPATIIGVTVTFACYHEMINLLAHWHDPPFFQSFAWPFILMCDAAGCLQMAFSWWQYWRGRPQLSYYLGTPFLMALRLPFRLAWLCDIAIVFLAGVYLQQFDHALGVWFMWSTVGLLLTFIRGTQSHLRDIINTNDAHIYTGIVQRAVKRSTTRPTTKPATRNPDLPTGA
jgi:hypothetical protein